MQSYRCSLIVLAALLTATVSVGAQESPDLSETFLSDPANVEAGQALWQQQCRHCHGASAYPGKAPKLKPRRYKPSFVYSRITDGFRKMPAWKDVYNDEQRRQLVAFILSSKFSP